MPSDEDAYRKARASMVRAQLQARGIKRKKVLQAFSVVPRHRFVPAQLRPRAYQDRPLTIGANQTISQPYMVAVMTELADVKPGDRVLEVGTGSGYQSALLAEMGATVYSVERIPELAERAAQILEELGYDQVTIKVGDGTLGWPEKAPFDVIIVTAGAPAVPDALRQQLTVGGRLIIPVETNGSQILSKITRRSQTEFSLQKHDRCVFVPLIGEQGW